MLYTTGYGEKINLRGNLLKTKHFGDILSNIPTPCTAGYGEN